MAPERRPSMDQGGRSQSTLHGGRLRSAGRTHGFLVAGKVPSVVDSIVAGQGGEGEPDAGDPTHDLGPYFEAAALHRRMNVSPETLEEMVQLNTLLAVEADRGAPLFPAWQFTPDVRTLPGLPKVLAELHRAATDGLSKAVWLTTPQVGLDGLSAAEWLRVGRDPEIVAHLARMDADRLLT